MLAGGTATRRKTKIPDYLLFFCCAMPLAVAEAEPNLLPAGTGLQQAEEYGTLLGLTFGDATNGTEYDAFTRHEAICTTLPTPGEILD